MKIPINVRGTPETFPEKLTDHIIESGLLNDRLIEVSPEKILIYPIPRNDNAGVSGLPKALTARPISRLY